MLIEGKNSFKKSDNVDFICSSGESISIVDNYADVVTISFGIRNISQSEIPFLKKNSSRINIFWAKDKNKWNLNKFKKLISSIP